jgi:hypothetical protein
MTDIKPVEEKSVKVPQALAGAPKDRALLAQLAAVIAAPLRGQNESLAVDVGVRMARKILEKIDAGTP